MNPTSEALQRFRSITGADAEVARRCLTASHGNIEAAVEMFYTSEQFREHRPEAPLQPRNQQPPGAQDGGGAVRAVSNFVAAVVTSPFRALRAVAERSLRAPDEPLLARDFVRAYEYHYGEWHPDFAELGWKEAAQLAERQSKFLFAYPRLGRRLQDTEAFCRHVLSSNQVVTFLNQNFICWGGTIHRSPGFVLANNTGAVTYPFMCLLGHIGGQITVMASVQGKVAGARLIDILQQSLDDQGAVLVAQRAERRQREIDRQLRQDQDLEYQRALEVDRERDRKNREAAAAQEAREAAARERAEQERLVKEAEERRKRDQQEAIAMRHREKQSTLKPEPEQTNNITQIRVRLPDGSTHNRKFLETDKVQDVYDFVDALENLHCWDYTLASSYPKIEFTSDTRDKTLKEMGVEHSATLLVQSHDD